MSRIIPAIFDAGVFKPLIPVQLAEGTAVEVQAPHAAEELDPAKVRAHWQAFLAKVKALPNEGLQDGFSNRDHDRAIYGE